MPVSRLPISAEDYAKTGDYFSDAQPLPGSSKLADVKSVGAMDSSIAQKDAKTAAPEQVINCSKAKSVDDGVW